MVLHYRNAALTTECLASLVPQLTDADVCFVVDNGSQDGSAEVAIAPFGNRVSCVSLAENRAIPGGINAGLRHALEESGVGAILVILNDATLEAGAVGTLRAALADDRRLGAVAPIQVRYEDPSTVHAAGGLIATRGWHVGQHAQGQDASLLPADKVLPAAWLDFTCVMIGAETLRRVGLLDESFRFYWDDVDWGLRANAAGLGLGVVTSARVRHRVGGTIGTGRSSVAGYYLVRNRLRSFRRAHGTAAVGRFLLREALATHRPGRAWRAYALRRRALHDEIARRPYPPM
jgi:GT2 family glycosyltransferase